MCIKSRDKKNKYPPRIREALETVELIVFVSNSGEGNALGAKLELVSINSGLAVQVRQAELGTIRPNETV